MRILCAPAAFENLNLNGFKEGLQTFCIIQQTDLVAHHHMLVIKLRYTCIFLIACYYNRTLTLVHCWAVFLQLHISSSSSSSPSSYTWMANGSGLTNAYFFLFGLNSLKAMIQKMASRNIYRQICGEYCRECCWECDLNEGWGRWPCVWRDPFATMARSFPLLLSRKSTSRRSRLECSFHQVLIDLNFLTASV